MLSKVDLWLEHGYSEELSPSSELMAAEMDDLTEFAEWRLLVRIGLLAKLKNILFIYFVVTREHFCHQFLQYFIP